MAIVISISHAFAQTTCSVPTGLSSSGITINSATVSWTPVATNVFYNVHYRTSPNTNWTSVTTQTPNANLINMLCGTNYEWQVQTGCPGLNGTVILSAFSPSSFFNTLSCTNVCAVPNGLSSTNNTSTSVTLNWNSTGATSYRIHYRATGTTAWTVVGSNFNFKNLTGLTPATAYEWQVRSKCVNGVTGTITYSAWSASSYFQTIGTTTCATPSGLSALLQGLNGVLLSWNSTGATSYNIRYKLANTTTWTTTTSTTNSKGLIGLASTSAYEWQVQGVCMINGTVTLSVWSASSFFTTNSALVISPNPANDKITVTSQSAFSQDVNISIRDFFGTTYSTMKNRSSEGFNQYELNTSMLHNGIYYVELSNAEGRQTIKFYVQH